MGMRGIKLLDSIFYKILVLRYEDVVLQPEFGLSEIASTVGVKAPTQKISLESVAIERDSMRLRALHTLRAAEYATNYTQKELSHLCRALDLSLLYEHGYTACMEDVSTIGF